MTDPCGRADIDTIIRISNTWIMRNSTHSRSNDLVDELARGVKALVLHFAGLAGAR